MNPNDRIKSLENEVKALKEEKVPALTRQQSDHSFEQQAVNAAIITQIGRMSEDIRTLMQSQAHQTSLLTNVNKLVVSLTDAATGIAKNAPGSKMGFIIGGFFLAIVGAVWKGVTYLWDLLHHGQ